MHSSFCLLDFAMVNQKYAEVLEQGIVLLAYNFLFAKRGLVPFVPDLFDTAT